MKKDKTKIPKGHYCYIRIDSNKTIPCPYYKTISTRPERLNGFCSFLGKGDIELSHERAKHQWEIIRHQKNGKEIKRNMTVAEKLMEVKSGGMSLLWDQCKECRINTGE